MFHLFSHCWSRLQAVREPIRKVTLLVVGLDNAGKTTLVMDLQRALAGEALPAVKPSQTQLRVDRFEVTLVDLPGGQRSRGAWRNHYGTAHGLLFVLDASDLARVEEARKVLARVLSHPNVSGKPLLLLANKQDAADALLPCELIERLSLEQLANANESPCRVEPCAAAARGPSRGALPGLRWLLRAADADYEALSARVRQPGPGAPRPGPAARPAPGAGTAVPPRRGAPLCLSPRESARGARRRKRKARRKGSEPEGPAGAGDGRAGLPPASRAGQAAPAAAGRRKVPAGSGRSPAGARGPSEVAQGPMRRGQGAKKKKRKKTRNKVKSQESALEQQYLYRRVMLALKMRQEQRKQPAAIAP